jgi:hypothetical protein
MTLASLVKKKFLVAKKREGAKSAISAMVIRIFRRLKFSRPFKAPNSTFE